MPASKSRMPSASPISQCGFGANAYVGFSPHMWSTGLSASPVPDGDARVRRVRDLEQARARLSASSVDSSLSPSLIFADERLQLVARGGELGRLLVELRSSARWRRCAADRIVSSSPCSLRRRSSRLRQAATTVATSPPRRRTSSIRAGSSISNLNNPRWLEGDPTSSSTMVASRAGRTSRWSGACGAPRRAAPRRAAPSDADTADSSQSTLGAELPARGSPRRDRADDPVDAGRPALERRILHPLHRARTDGIEEDAMPPRPRSVRARSSGPQCGCHRP